MHQYVKQDKPYISYFNDINDFSSFLADSRVTFLVDSRSTTRMLSNIYDYASILHQIWSDMIKNSSNRL